MNFKQGRTIRRGSDRFTGSSVSGAAGSRSLRRRLMAALRKAHRVLGMRRKGLGLGTLSAGNVLAAALGAIVLAGIATPASAQVFGGGGTANGVRGIAFGSGAVQNGADSIAEGTNANAGSQNAVAIGFQSLASQLNSIYLGSRTVAGTGATATSAIGIGTDVTASQVDAIAMGRQSVSSAQYAVAIGLNAKATGAGGAMALGQGTVSSGVNSVALGVNANATAAGANALGTFALASGGNSTALGTSSTASGNYATAAGWGSVASGADSTAVGREAGASALDATAMGYISKASGQYSTAVGANANATATSSTAIGQNASATGVQATALGVGANAGAQNAIAMGLSANASATSTIAIGTTAKADSAEAVAMGTNAVATGGKAVSIGSGNTAYGNGAVSIGDPSYASGTGAFTGGANNIANSDGTATATAANMANGAVAIGNNNKAIGQGSVALGNGSTAGAAGLAGNVALGNGATAAASSGDVALGSGSVTATAVGTSGATIGTTAYSFAGTNPTSTVSVGAPGAERTITNVAAGRLSNSSTDAINGSQLFATNQQVTQNTTAIAANTADITNLGNTITNINTGGGIKYFHANSTLPDSQALGTNSVAVGPNAVANNAGDVAIGLNSASRTTTAVGGTTIGGVNYTFAGTTPAGAFSVGSVGAERQIQNVAAGRLSNSSTDAVNGSQLFATNQQVTQNTTAIAANTADITNLGNTITNINTGGGIKYFHANSTLADSQALGTNSVAVGPNAVANNAGDVAIGLNSASRTTTAVGGTTIGGVNYTFAGTNPAGAFSVGSVGAERQIQNVAAGRLSNSSTDAVNGSQLFATNQQVTQNTTAIAANTADITNLGNTITNINTGGGIKYFHANSTLPDSQALGTNSVAVGPNAVANNAGDVAIGLNSVSRTTTATGSTTIGGVNYTFAGGTPAGAFSVGSVGAERQIQNVAAGQLSNSSTDAVNGSQLFATNQQVTQNTTDIAANTADITNLGNTINSISTGGGIKYFHANSTLADSQALGTNSVAVGPNAVANNAGDVAIGLNSVSRTTTAVGGTTIGGVAYTFAGGTPAGAFSVGSVGAERQIQNVAAGQLSNSSTDAVNGSQLFATNQQVTQNTTDIAANTADIAANTTDITNLGNAISNIAGDTSTAYTNANGEGIRYVRTNDTTLPVTDAFAQGVGSSALGYQATASAADSLALGRGTQATVTGGVALGSGSVSDRAVAPASGSILSGTGLIPFNTSDATLLGAVSVGTSTSYRQIINVADGTQDQDAVTLRQLKGALSSFAVTGNMYFHANSTASDSLAVGTDSVAVGPRTTVNGDNGIGIGNGAIVQQTAPGGIAIGQNATSNQADSIALGTNSTTNGAQAVALGAGAKANEPGSVALGAGSTTAAAVATTGTTINGVNYTFAGTNPTSTVSVGSVGNERTITNVAAGQISGTSTDAINGSQLYATNQAVEAVKGSVGDLNEFAVQYDKNGDGSKSNSITLTGGDPNAPVVIHNVGAGVANTDAVNVQQLNTGLATTLDSSKSYTNQVAATTLQTANAYTDSKLSQLNMDMDEARGEARQAAAIGLAAASLRYDDRPGKLSVAAGGGYWRGEGAVAFGAGYTSEDGRARANLSGTTAGGHWGVGAGVSFTLN